MEKQTIFIWTDYPDLYKTQEFINFIKEISSLLEICYDVPIVVEDHGDEIYCSHRIFNESHRLIREYWVNDLDEYIKFKEKFNYRLELNDMITRKKSRLMVTLYMRDYNYEIEPESIHEISKDAEIKELIKKLKQNVKI
jgi:hypothetical protein